MNNILMLILGERWKAMIDAKAEIAKAIEQAEKKKSSAIRSMRVSLSPRRRKCAL